MVLGDVKVRQLVVYIHDFDVGVAGGRQSRLAGISRHHAVRVQWTTLEVQLYAGKKLHFTALYNSRRTWE